MVSMLRSARRIRFVGFLMSTTSHELSDSATTVVTYWLSDECFSFEEICPPDKVDEN